MDDKSFLTDSLERVADALRNAGVDYALAGRPQDIVDIGAIERKRASELDRDYLDGWLNRWAAP